MASAPPSPSPGPSAGPANRHAPTAVERQRLQLEKLLKDPAKPVHIPTPAKEKTIRPPREMMKNVQGSSAGAGSGEFHVYKASRRREYDRLKIMDETNKKELATKEFEDKKRQWEDDSSAKTAKNRAKRLKKKEKGKGKGGQDGGKAAEAVPTTTSDAPLKKRRLVNGKEMVFKKPGEEDESDSEQEDAIGPGLETPVPSADTGMVTSAVAVVDAPRIIIHDD